MGAPTKKKRSPIIKNGCHWQKRGAPGSGGGPAGERSLQQETGAPAKGGAPSEERAPCRRGAPSAEEGRPSRREAPQQKLIRDGEPSAEVGLAKQDRGAPLTISGRRQTPQQQMGAPGRRGAPHYKKKRSIFYQEGRP